MTCNCNRTGDVEYQITLDSQGPQGRQGDAGPAGFSPIVEDYNPSENNYQLRIITADGEIITPNLKGQTPELPAGLVDANISNVFREVNYFENGLKANYVTIKTPNYDYKIDAALNDITVTKIDNTTGDAESNLIAYHKDLEPYVLETNLDTKLENYVTLDTTQTITGGKNFDKGIIIAEHSLINAVGLRLGTPDGIYCSIGKNDALLPTNTYLGRIGNSNNLVLTPNLIKAGEGINITNDGYLTISATGGSEGATIDDATVTTNTTWSSSKIDSEVTTAVETINSTKNDNIFDINKFTVVGSPTITDDGVASGFSAGINYVRVSSGIASISQNYATWEMIEKFTTSTVSGQQYLMVGNTSWTNLIFLRENKLCWCLRSTESSRYDLANYQVGTHSFSVNTTYYIKFKYDGAKYSLEYSTDGKNFTEDLSITSNLKLNDSATSIILGTYFMNANTNFIGSIDLKHFSITADGVEVFNGLMESTKPIYDKITSTSAELSTFQTDTDTNFSAVNSALNEKANLSDLANYVPLATYNTLVARVTALEEKVSSGGGDNASQKSYITNVDASVSATKVE